VSGVDARTQQRMMNVAFNIRPGHSTLGDVLVSGPTKELMTGMGRFRHAVSGSGMHHTAIGLPERMNEWAFNAGRGQGIQRWRGDLSDLPHSGVVLRPKLPMDPERLTSTINEAFNQPYSYGRLRRLGIQEAISLPWTDKAAPTVMEKIFKRLGESPTVRKYSDLIPGLREQLVRNRAGERLCKGHVCSTAIADALQKAEPQMFAGKNPLGVSPGDFLRNAGKQFDVTALNLPSKLRTRPQLLLNHLLKAGPMVTRLAAAAPFIGAGAYFYNRVNQPEESMLDKLRKSVSGFLG